MGQNEKPRVHESDNIRKIIVEISSKRLGTTAVVDDNENLVGIITDGDLRRMLETQDQVAHLTASDIMSSHPKFVDSQMLAVDALAVMRQHSISQLLVKSDNRYKGVLHIHDLIREGII